MTKWTVIKVHAVVENFCILLNIVFWSLNQQEQLGANKKDLIKSNSWSNSTKVLFVYFFLFISLNELTTEEKLRCRNCCIFFHVTRSLDKHPQISTTSQWQWKVSYFFCYYFIVFLLILLIFPADLRWLSAFVDVL